MSETKKIKKEELKELTEVLTGISSLQNQIGAIEANKHELLHDHALYRSKLSDIQSKLKEEYGDIVVDVNDGTYTIKE
jgi:SMC interacting uncharacterized protein involved in chromosome segregation